MSFICGIIVGIVFTIFCFGLCNAAKTGDMLNDVCVQSNKDDLNRSNKL